MADVRGGRVFLHDIWLRNLAVIFVVLTSRILQSCFAAAAVPSRSASPRSPRWNVIHEQTLFTYGKEQTDAKTFWLVSERADGRHQLVRPECECFHNGMTTHHNTL